MPKLICSCGFVHNLSPIPDDGWITVRDADYEALVEFERPAPGMEQTRPDAFVRLTGSLYECPDCGRIMWAKPGDPSFRIFRPDS
jgi:predicted RNA-binding Zn-ribbon protein involved in translation (DUF1610 family)